MSLVTVAQFTEPHDAHIARSLLAAHDVPAFVVDEHYVGVNWLISNALGGVKLLVTESDKTSALELLAVGDESISSPEESFECCPRCESEHVGTDKFDHRLRAISLWIGFPLGIGQYRFHCDSCGHDWRERPPYRNVIFRFADFFALVWITVYAIVLLPIRLIRRLLGTREPSMLACWSCQQSFRSDASQCPACGIQLPPLLAYEKVIEVGADYDAACSSCHTPYRTEDYQGAQDTWQCSICRAALGPEVE